MTTAGLPDSEPVVPVSLRPPPSTSDGRWRAQFPRLALVEVQAPPPGVSSQETAVIHGGKVWLVPCPTPSEHARIAECLVNDYATGRNDFIASLGAPAQERLAPENRALPPHQRVSLREIPDGLGRRALAMQGLRPETIESSHFRDSWACSEFGAAVFRHSRGPCSELFYGAEGDLLNHKDRPGLWQGAVPSDVSRVVVVDRAVDAMSFHQLRGDPTTHYVSIGGVLTTEQKTELKALLDQQLNHNRAQGRPGPAVVAAFSKSLEGAAFTRALEDLKPPALALERALPTSGRTWTATLQAKEREYIRSQGLQTFAPARELGR